jgi:hypothetical protein
MLLAFRHQQDLDLLVFLQLDECAFKCSLVLSPHRASTRKAPRPGQHKLSFRQDQPVEARLLRNNESAWKRTAWQLFGVCKRPRRQMPALLQMNCLGYVKELLLDILFRFSQLTGTVLSSLVVLLEKAAFSSM